MFSYALSISIPERLPGKLHPTADTQPVLLRSMQLVLRPWLASRTIPALHFLRPPALQTNLCPLAVPRGPAFLGRGGPGGWMRMRDPLRGIDEIRQRWRLLTRILTLRPCRLISLADTGPLSRPLRILLPQEKWDYLTTPEPATECVAHFFFFFSNLTEPSFGKGGQNSVTCAFLRFAVLHTRLLTNQAAPSGATNG